MGEQRPPGVQGTLEVQHLTPVLIETADVGDQQITRAKLAEDALGGDFTGADRLKLDGIEPGAETNVQANWNETDPSHDEYIQHKPEVLSRTDVQGLSLPQARAGSTQPWGTSKIADDAITPDKLDADTPAKKQAQRDRIGAIDRGYRGWPLYETLPDAGTFQIGDIVAVRSGGEAFLARGRSTDRRRRRHCIEVAQLPGRPDHRADHGRGADGQVLRPAV